MIKETQKEKIVLLSEKFNGIAQYLNEKSKRIWAATEAKALGY